MQVDVSVDSVKMLESETSPSLRILPDSQKPLAIRDYICIDVAFITSIHGERGFETPEIRELNLSGKDFAPPVDAVAAGVFKGDLL